MTTGEFAVRSFAQKAIQNMQKLLFASVFFLFFAFIFSVPFEFWRCICVCVCVSTVTRVLPVVFVVVVVLSSFSAITRPIARSRLLCFPSTLFVFTDGLAMKFITWAGRFTFYHFHSFSGTILFSSRRLCHRSLLAHTTHSIGAVFVGPARELLLLLVCAFVFCLIDSHVCNNCYIVRFVYVIYVTAYVCSTHCVLCILFSIYWRLAVCIPYVVYKSVLKMLLTSIISSQWGMNKDDRSSLLSIIVANSPADLNKKKNCLAQIKKKNYTHCRACCRVLSLLRSFWFRFINFLRYEKEWKWYCLIPVDKHTLKF